MNSIGLHRAPSVYVVPAYGLVTTAISSLPVFLIGALAVEMRRSMQFPSFAIGACFSAFFAASAVGSVLSAIAFERIDRARVIRSATAMTAICLLVIPLIGSWDDAVPLLAACGLANSAGQMGANLLIADLLNTGRQGLAFGIKQSGVPTATLLAGAAVPSVAVMLGWKWTFWSAGLATLCYAVFVRWPVHGAVKPTTVRSRYKSNSWVAAVAALTIAAALGAAAADALAAFYVDSAVGAGMPAARAGVLLACGSATAVGSRIVMGYLADRALRRTFRAVSMMLLAGAFGYAILASGSTVGAYVAAFVCFGAGWGWPGIYYLSVMRANPQREALATGVVQGGTFAGAVCGPLAFGLIATHASFAWAWEIFALLLVLAAGGVWLGKRLTPSAI